MIKIDRQLGLTEQAMEIMNHYDKYFIVTVSRIKGNLNETLVRQALDLLQYRHPRLNSRIVGSLDNLRFETEGTQKIPLRVIKKFHNKQWQEVLQEELNQKLDSTKGLVRSVLIHIGSEDNICYLIITVHHAIALASSVLRLHSEILAYCENIVTEKPITFPDKLPAFPSIEELLPKSTKGFTGAINNLSFLLNTLFKTTLHRPKDLGLKKYPSLNYHPCNMTIHRQLDKNLTQQLVNTCREKKTTVQGALCAAMLLAAAQLIDSNKKNHGIICHSSIDIRKFIEPIISNEHLVVSCSYTTGYFHISTNTPFWDLACKAKQQIEVSLMNRHELFSKIFTYKKMIDICLKNPNVVPDSIAVTNIGKLNIPQEHDLFIIEQISFFPIQSIINNNLTVAVTTFNEQMVLNFMFSEPSITRQKMEKFVGNVLDLLQKSILGKCNHI